MKSATSHEARRGGLTRALLGPRAGIGMGHDGGQCRPVDSARAALRADAPSPRGRADGAGLTRCAPSRFDKRGRAMRKAESWPALPGDVTIVPVNVGPGAG